MQEQKRNWLVLPITLVAQNLFLWPGKVLCSLVFLSQFYKLIFFNLTKILLITTNNYKITILVENYFALLAYVELFVSSEAVGIEN